MDHTESCIKPCQNNEPFNNPELDDSSSVPKALSVSSDEITNKQPEKSKTEGNFPPTSNKIPAESFTNCFESFSKQLNNASLSSSFQKMYEIYSMTALSDSMGENEKEARNSVLEAILEIEFCNIPLRQEVIDLLISSGDSNYKKPLKYEDFVRVESSLNLHKHESERMEELTNACQLLRNPYKHVVNKTNQLVDAVKVTEAAIRRLIKMSKRLSAFNKLSQNDQISLLKGSIIEMMCIRATTNYNSEQNFWYFIDDNNQGVTMVSMDVLKNANWINFMSHKNFAIKFNAEFKNDPMIADLVSLPIDTQDTHYLSTYLFVS